MRTKNRKRKIGTRVSILILLDYLFLLVVLEIDGEWLEGLNPYFIGLSILIILNHKNSTRLSQSQSLFYWIIYSYTVANIELDYKPEASLNPYFIGLSILINPDYYSHIIGNIVSILILLDYLFLYFSITENFWRKYSLNPYFIGLSILIRLL